MIKYKNYLPYIEEDIANCIHKTPLVKTNRLAEYFGINNLYLKLDSCLPFSNTFKDRGAVTAISHVLQNNQKKLFFASCGNMGAAMALIAAKKGIEIFAILSNEASLANKISIYNSGANVIEYAGRFDEIDDIISEFSETYPLLPCVNTNLMDIYSLGLKTLYFEIFDDLSNIYNEINIIVPTADGTLMKGLFLGYKEFSTLNPNFKVHFIAVQPSGCAPIVKAFVNNDKIVNWTESNTDVLSLSVNNPKLNGEIALSAIKETGGVAISVNENLSSKFSDLLLANEGILTDDVGSMVIGSLDILKNIKFLCGIPTVCLLTGNGLKTIETRTIKKEIVANNKSDVLIFLSERI